MKHRGNPLHFVFSHRRERAATKLWMRRQPGGNWKRAGMDTKEATYADVRRMGRQFPGRKLREFKDRLRAHTAGGCNCFDNF